jgi:hypothetical protein
MFVEAEVTGSSIPDRKGPRAITKYYYFRVTGSITLEMYVSEEEIRRNGSEVAPTEEAVRNLEREIKDKLENLHSAVVEALRLDQVSFERDEESE